MKKKSKLLTLTALALATVVGLSGCGLGNVKPYAKNPVVPNLNLSVINPHSSGYKRFDLASLKNHIVILYFWTMTDTSKNKYLHLFENFYKSEPPKNKIIVVGVNLNGICGLYRSWDLKHYSRNAVRSFVKKQGVTFPVVYAGNRCKLMNDTITDLLWGYDVVNTPKIYYIYKGRHIVGWTGFINKDTLQQTLNNIHLGRPFNYIKMPLKTITKRYNPER